MFTPNLLRKADAEGTPCPVTVPMYMCTVLRPMSCRNPRVLVVDDQPDNVMFLMLALEMEGLEVVAAGGGRECLELVHRQAPQLLVLDVMMPDLDGRQVLARLRSDPELPHFPVMMLTADHSPLESYSPRPDRLLHKPVALDELTAAVRELLHAATQPS